MAEKKRLLVTGPAGNVGRVLIERLLNSPEHRDYSIRALCYRRTIPEHSRIEVLSGNIEDRATVQKAMLGVTHVLHLATCKEDPTKIIDVTVKGMFWLLEEARKSPDFQQFMLIGGDAAVGHMYLQREHPITEEQRHTAYKGCYALSKVLEEVLLEQYYIQYDLNGCCLRAPWIMCNDDFKRQLSFGPDVFGEPRWGDLVGPEAADRYYATHTVPVLLDLQGQPVLRNFVYVEDLVAAILLALGNPVTRQQTYNICMDEPVNYRQVAAYLQKTRNYPSVEIKLERYSNWLDNRKARWKLNWRPQYDLERMIEAAYAC